MWRTALQAAVQISMACVVVTFLVVSVRAQSTAITLERFRYLLDDHARRIVNLETGAQSPGVQNAIVALQVRLAVIEDNMVEIRWTGRTVAAGFATFLIGNGLNLLFRRREPE
jgi:hypothetical protein